MVLVYLCIVVVVMGGWARILVFYCFFGFVVVCCLEVVFLVRDFRWRDGFNLGVYFRICL